MGKKEPDAPETNRNENAKKFKGKPSNYPPCPPREKTTVHQSIPPNRWGY